MWPDAPEVLWDVLTRYDVPESDINKITHEKVASWQGAMAHAAAAAAPR